LAGTHFILQHKCCL